MQLYKIRTKQISYWGRNLEEGLKRRDLEIIVYLMKKCKKKKLMYTKINYLFYILLQNTLLFLLFHYYYSKNYFN